MPLVHLTNGYNLMLTSAFSTAATAATQITGLSFPAVAGDVWDLWFNGEGQCSSTSGMWYAILAPIGSTLTGYMLSSSTNQSAANLLYLGVAAPNTTFGNVHVGASAAYRNDIGGFRLVIGATAGTVGMAVAAVAGTASVNVNSQFRALRATLV